MKRKRRAILFFTLFPIMLGSDSYPYTVRVTGGSAIARDTRYEGSVNEHSRGADYHTRVLRTVREKTVDAFLSCWQSPR